MNAFYPKRTGVYHLCKDINEIEFKVQLQQIKSMLQFSEQAANATATAKTENTVARLDKQPKQLDERARLQAGECITVNFKWQQKIFSENELKLYKDAKNCLNETQKTYHNLLKEQEAQLPPSNRKKGKSHSQKQKHKSKATTIQTHLIYSYVQMDAHVPQGEQGPMLPYGNKRQFAAAAVVDDEDAAAAVATADALDEGADVEKPIKSVAYQYMYIYAALLPDILLMQFTWDPLERQLYIYPDFCQTPFHAYYIEIDSNRRHMYSYSCINVTKMRMEKTKTKQIQIYKPPAAASVAVAPTIKIAKRKIPKFDMPPRRRQRVQLYFELRSGYQFEYDNIHVRYHIALPKYTIREQGYLEASTQSCYVSSGGHGRAQAAYFAYTWNITLLCEEAFQPNAQMHIYFEVISIDGWGRQRDEGYAHYACRLLDALPHSKKPLQPIKLQCVLMRSSWLASLYRYFFGGRPSFDYAEYFTPKQQQNTELTQQKMLPVQNTGILEFCISKIQQHYCELTPNIFRSNAGRPMNLLLDDIVQSYNEAKVRLEQITKRFKMSREKMQSEQQENQQKQFRKNRKIDRFALLEQQEATQTRKQEQTKTKHAATTALEAQELTRISKTKRKTTTNMPEQRVTREGSTKRKHKEEKLRIRKSKSTTTTQHNAKEKQLQEDQIMRLTERIEPMATPTTKQRRNKKKQLQTETDAQAQQLEIVSNRSSPPINQQQQQLLFNVMHTPKRKLLFTEPNAEITRITKENQTKNEKSLMRFENNSRENERNKLQQLPTARKIKSTDTESVQCASISATATAGAANKAHGIKNVGKQ